jgi:hypothetical protein
MDPSSSSSDATLIPGMDPWSSSSDVAEIPGMNPRSSSSDALPIAGTYFFLFHDGDKPPLEFVCLFLYILYFLSHYINNPPSEFVCLFLYILYFPHTMATTLPGICLSRFFAFFTFLSQRQKN